jgi:hypothetical protein
MKMMTNKGLDVDVRVVKAPPRHKKDAESVWLPAHVA